VTGDVILILHSPYIAVDRSTLPNFDIGVAAGCMM
jgi:hypothetical protein